MNCTYTFIIPLGILKRPFRPLGFDVDRTHPARKDPPWDAGGHSPWRRRPGAAVASGRAAVFRRAHAQPVAAPGRRHGGLMLRVPAGGGRNRILCPLPGKGSF